MAGHRTACLSTRACSPSAALLASLAAVLLLGGAARAVVTRSSWQISFDDLKPTIDMKYGHKFYYQIPPNPRGTVMLIHGCVHSGYNYFPRSADCMQCRGLPEEMSHVLQALNNGYAAIAISSGDRVTGCWSWNLDAHDVKHLMEDWMDENNLSDLPLYGMGISSGASFVLKMPRYLKFAGLVSEALGVDPEYWGLQKVQDGYPPTLFVAMMRDEQTVSKILEDRSLLVQLGRPVSIIKVYPRLVYPTYFSDRDPLFISKGLSQQITAALRKIKMIDGEGTVLLDPRYTTKPWLKQLKAEVRELQGPVTSFKDTLVPEWNDTIATDTKVAAVYSLMNLAYAYHEIISDYATVALAWFESGCQADLNDLRAKFTYGLPPPEYRQQVAMVAEDPMAPLMQGLDAATELTQQSLGTHDAEALGVIFRRSAREVGRDEAAAAGALHAETKQQQQQQQQGAGVAAEAAEDRDAAGDEQLLELAEEVEQALDPAKELVLSVPLPAHLVSRSTAPRRRASKLQNARRSAAQPASGRGSKYGSYSNSLLGSAMGGAAFAVLLAVLAWVVVKYVRSTPQAISLSAATMQAVHQPAPAHHVAGGSARLSVIPGVKERFEYEIVEQTGSPYSARRRIKTAFNESPRKVGSPARRSGV